MDGLPRRLSHHGPSLELGRADLTERRMSSSPLVIEHFNEVKQGHLRLAVAIEPFVLTVAKKLSITALP